MSERLQRIVAPIIVLIAILLLWEGLVSFFEIEQFLLPKPSAIVSNLITLDATVTGERLFGFGDGLVFYRGKGLSPILAAARFTLKEALGGLSIGVSAGLLVALATARWLALSEALLPFAIAVNSMPIIAFAPIMNNWFGIDNPFSKMAIVALMVFFPIMINTTRGLMQVDANSLELMRSYAASDFEILRRLRIPNALPFVFSGLKVAASLSMIGAIVGEYFGGPRIALGVYITQEASMFRFSSAWAAIIIACIIGITLYLIVAMLERLCMPWHSSFRS